MTQHSNHEHVLWSQAKVGRSCPLQDLVFYAGESGFRRLSINRFDDSNSQALKSENQQNFIDKTPCSSRVNRYEQLLCEPRETPKFESKALLNKNAVHNN